MMSRDGISGLVCLAISIALLTQTFGLPPATIVPIGPAFYPRVVLFLLMLVFWSLVKKVLHTFGGAEGGEST
jgi:hypothetical protein